MIRSSEARMAPFMRIDVLIAFSAPCETLNVLIYWGILAELPLKGNKFLADLLGFISVLQGFGHMFSKNIGAFSQVCNGSGYFYDFKIAPGW